MDVICASVDGQVLAVKEGHSYHTERLREKEYCLR